MRKNRFYLQQDAVAIYTKQCSFLNFWVIDDKKKYFHDQDDSYSGENPEFVQAINWLLAN
jgi:hypothetical protein